MSDARRIEKDYKIDLDAVYQGDKCASIMESLKYSSQDERDGKPNPSSLKFYDGANLYKTLPAYRQALKEYLKFLESEARVQISVGAFAVMPASADEAPFDPANFQDARNRVLRSIIQRRGQKDFRDRLIAAYDGKCAITGCDVLDVLEAAHIFPYRGLETNAVSNGLLLRADLHTLFDCGLISVDSNSFEIRMAPSLGKSEYNKFSGKILRLPTDPALRPSQSVLLERQRLSAQFS